MRFFLKKEEILSSANQIDDLFKNGIVQNGFLFDIIYQPAAKTKILVAVSRKVKSHVKKNRIKRKLREVYRLNKKIVPQNFHFALIGKKEVGEAEFQSLNDEFKNCLKRVGKNEKDSLIAHHSL
jgi:ribonuclease P protein component